MGEILAYRPHLYNLNTTTLDWKHIKLTGGYLWRNSAKVAQVRSEHCDRCQRINVLYFSFSEATPSRHCVKKHSLLWPLLSSTKLDIICYRNK